MSEYPEFIRELFDAVNSLPRGPHGARFKMNEAELKRRWKQLNNPPLYDGQPVTILGVPVVLDEDIPDGEFDLGYE